MKRILFSMLIAAILSSWIAVRQIAAQDELPPWVNENNCPKILQEYNGLGFCSAQEAGKGKAYVIIVDLHRSGIKFEYVIARGWNPKTKAFEPCPDVNVPAASTGEGCREKGSENLYPIMSLLNAVSYAGSPAVIIDTDYGAKTGSQGHGPEGLAIISGKRIDGPRNGDYDSPGGSDPNTNNAVRRPWLALSLQAPFTVLIDRIPKDQDDGDEYQDWIETAFGGGPWLIREGKLNPTINDCKDVYPKPDYDTIYDRNSCAPLKDQTAVGISRDGRWLYFVITLGFPTARDTAKFMSENLEVWQAIKLDGGGSSQLWYSGLNDGEKLADRTVADGDGRWLSQYLAIYAEPGGGVQTEPTPIPPPVPVPTPTPPPGTDGGLFDRLIEWWKSSAIYQLIQSIRELVDNADSAIEDFRQLLRDLQSPYWWIEQLAKWTLDCMGAAAIPAVLAVLARRLFIRKHK